MEVWKRQGNSHFFLLNFTISLSCFLVGANEQEGGEGVTADLTWLTDGLASHFAVASPDSRVAFPVRRQTPVHSQYYESAASRRVIRVLCIITLHHCMRVHQRCASSSVSGKGSSVRKCKQFNY